eukprot:Gb_40045 [translate_table: standard]
MRESYLWGQATAKNHQKDRQQLITGMVVNRPLKRAKRVVADYHSFHSFATKGCPGGDRPLDGPFRTNIRTFLLAYAEGPRAIDFSSSPFVEKWRVRLRLDDVEGVSITLNIIEEYVEFADSAYCDQCRVVAGWNGHPVCKTRYHFIIRADNNSSPADKWTQPCPCCGTSVSFLASRCKSCDFEVTKDNELEDGANFVVEDPTHLLHGVIHANGFGHLLRVNGREGGSKFLSGCEIMDLWDRICIMLKVRKISVMDVSKKYGLDYRLLHALQKGHPWYGNWGYKFGTGSFALTYESYKTAVEILSNVPLTSVLSDVGKYDRHLNRVVSFYCSLSKKPIVTVQDLVCYIMELLHKFHGQTKLGKHSGGGPFSVDKASINAVTAESKWTSEEVEEATSAILKVLQVADKSRWVTLRDLRGATCHGRDPELLDSAMRGLEGKIVGKHTVQCRCMSAMRTLEYRLKDMDSMALESDNESMIDSKWPMKEHLLEDLKYIYNALLYPMPTSGFQYSRLSKQCTDASRKLLDCKQFIKDYEANHPFVSISSSSIRVFAVAEILEELKTLEKPPCELLILPQNATVADLKFEAARAFRDVYICFHNFQVENIPQLQDVKDSMQLMMVIGAESMVIVQGQCYGDISMFRTERGTLLWTVDCSCGTREDDGEQMVACDNCEVWQHTRCVGISDTEDVPLEFICKRCGHKHFETALDSDFSMPGSSSISSL